MKTFLKYLPWILVCIAIACVAFYYWNNNRNLQALLETRNSELMQANLEIGRANTKIADANALVSKLSDQIKDEIKQRKAILTLYAELETRYEAEKKKVKTITKILYKDNYVDLPKGKLYFRAEDGTYEEVKSIRYSYKDFRIDIEGDAIEKTISYKLHQRFRATFVESQLPGGGKNHYAELYEMDDESKDVGKMKLDRFDVYRSEDLPAKIWWWNPKLDLMIGGGISHIANFIWVVDLGLSISGYGTTSDDLKWRFFRIGTGFTAEGFSLTFSPAQYNIAKNLPLLSNVWVSPYVGRDFGQSVWHFGTGISVVF